MSKSGQGLQLQPPESKEEGGSWGAGPPTPHFGGFAVAFGLESMFAVTSVRT